jgi:tRNA(fMet)-specific endonuclease VapC
VLVGSNQPEKDVMAQVPAYAELTGLIEFFSLWTILPFDESAAQTFVSLRKQKLRRGTMDLKIASIAVASDALLLTANTPDFEMVPNLRIEDWTT